MGNRPFKENLRAVRRKIESLYSDDQQAWDKIDRLYIWAGLGLPMHLVSLNAHAEFCLIDWGDGYKLVSTIDRLLIGGINNRPLIGGINHWDEQITF
jgi:hypothetical protein